MRRAPPCSGSAGSMVGTSGLSPRSRTTKPPPSFPTLPSGAASTANQTKHLLHGMFKWAKQPGQKFVTVNPFSDLPMPGGPAVKRDRFLTEDEIRQVWHALSDPKSLGIKPDAATALRLILVT